MVRRRCLPSGSPSPCWAFGFLLHASWAAHFAAGQATTKSFLGSGGVVVVTTNSPTTTTDLQAAQVAACGKASSSGYPPCPAQGCLPCPANAGNWPNCACVAGYTAVGVPTSTQTSSTSTASSTVTSTSTTSSTRSSTTTTPWTTTTTTQAPGTSTTTRTTSATSTRTTTSSAAPTAPACALNKASPPLLWDAERAWIGTCMPETCGAPPQPAHADPVSGFLPLQVVYPEVVRYQCEVGYTAEGYRAPAFGTGVQEVTGYATAGSTYCTNDQARNLQVVPGLGASACQSRCDANKTCWGYEVTCDGRCILLADCDEQLPSKCGTSLSVKQVVQLERLVEFKCAPGGLLVNTTGSVCMPICGDGLLVSIDHLPMYSPLEQCDDGNTDDGDGCSRYCRVEAGWVCSGGSPTGPDICARATEYATSALWITITGARLPDSQELADATQVALAEALPCPRRDIEILEVNVAGYARTTTPRTTVTSTSSTVTTTSPASAFHGYRVDAQVRFEVKVSNPDDLTLTEIVGSLVTSGVLGPRLLVAFAQTTSLRDVYVQVVGLQAPSTVGLVSLTTEKEALLLVRETILSIFLRVGWLGGYFVLIGCLVPWLYWYLVIRRRRYTLAGRFDEVSGEFKDAWAFTICGWTQRPGMCCVLLVCLPTRLADTWDAMGLVPYWTGVRKAFCCCLLYVFGCGLCAATIPGAQRSEIRDFFGFGDKVHGNLEASDYCCYVCCPLCCIIQEARHVDGALRVLPPPLKDWEVKAALQQEDAEVAIQELTVVAMKSAATRADLA